ncbi:MAG: YkgJ family cysteine cluster protein [Promethearchaeota archaeon]|nr:MAG: YkgJ family cysteine cluster protein [Candidatus Lokiarchaeota archaeon]
MTEENKNNTPEEEISQEAGKSKFVFHCTQCGWCCENRGPIPITFWDLEMWAKNGVLDNFMAYLKINITSTGGYDLILAPLKFDPYKKLMEQQQKLMKEMAKQKAKEAAEKGGKVDLELAEEKPEEETEPDIDEIRCPLFNLEKRECLVYNYRPLSCRTYPLEYDGEGFNIIDEDNCEGIGQEPMTKEELKEMRDNAKLAYNQMATMKISIPVLFNVIGKDPLIKQQIQQELIMEMMQQQQKAMESMDPEDRKKLDEILQKNQTATDDTKPPDEEK